MIELRGTHEQDAVKHLKAHERQRHANPRGHAEYEGLTERREETIAHGASEEVKHGQYRRLRRLCRWKWLAVSTGDGKILAGKAECDGHDEGRGGGANQAQQVSGPRVQT